MSNEHAKTMKQLNKDKQSADRELRRQEIRKTKKRAANLKKKSDKK